MVPIIGKPPKAAWHWQFRASLSGAASLLLLNLYGVSFYVPFQGFGPMLTLWFGYCSCKGWSLNKFFSWSSSGDEMILSIHNSSGPYKTTNKLPITTPKSLTLMLLKPKVEVIWAKWRPRSNADNLVHIPKNRARAKTTSNAPLKWIMLVAFIGEYFNIICGIKPIHSLACLSCWKPNHKKTSKG